MKRNTLIDSTEIATTEWQAYPHYGMRRYRIQKRRQFGIWQQRHEWEHTDGTRETTEWIRSTAPSTYWLACCTITQSPEAAEA